MVFLPNDVIRSCCPSTMMSHNINETYLTIRKMPISWLEEMQ